MDKALNQGEFKGYNKIVSDYKAELLLKFLTWQRTNELHNIPDRELVDLYLNC